MLYFAGIDLGSTSIKIVLIDESENSIGKAVVASGCHFERNATDALDRLLADKMIKKDHVVYTIATGYGRMLYKSCHERVNELAANAAGAGYYETDVKINTIINVGGQDTKVIQLDEQGRVKSFVMNDKCAAGTGKFLEIAARNLEVDIDAFEELYFSTEEALAVNSTCAVFAESEIITLLAAGHPKSGIAAGIHESIAKRIVRLTKKIQVNDAVLFDGGLALNKGMTDALEMELMKKIYVLEDPQCTTALGAAVLARRKYMS